MPTPLRVINCPRSFARRAALVAVRPPARKKLLKKHLFQRIYNLFGFRLAPLCCHVHKAPDALRHQGPAALPLLRTPPNLAHCPEVASVKHSQKIAAEKAPFPHHAHWSGFRLYKAPAAFSGPHRHHGPAFAKAPVPPRSAPSKDPPSQKELAVVTSSKKLASNNTGFPHLGSSPTFQDTAAWPARPLLPPRGFRASERASKRASE